MWSIRMDYSWQLMLEWGKRNGCKQVKFMTKNQNNNDFKFERTMKCKTRKN